MACLPLSTASRKMRLPRSSFLRIATFAAIAAGTAIAVSGCAVSVPVGVKPVAGFDARRYMGTWYELARIDHRFEKGLTRTSAHYTLNDDGTVKVVNRGFDASRQEWRESEGRARFLGDPSIAALKVSFFGPFYGGYNVVSLDDGYQTALVVGSSPEYFWLLSRSKQIPADKLKALLEKAQDLGIDLRRVLLVEQE